MFRIFPLKISNFTAELKRISFLALPIIIAQLAQTSMGFVDTLMSGHYSSTDLAAVALGSSIWLPIFLASQGILMATTPLVAHQIGANALNSTPKTFHQGVLIAGILCLINIVLLNNMAPVLNLMQVEEQLAAITLRYLEAISWGFPALLFYQLIRSFIEGCGHTKPAMVISILGLICNIPLNYLLIYGELGFPELGGVGCGWATTLVMWIMLCSAAYYLRLSPTFSPLQLLKYWQSPKLTELFSFLRLGLPIGVALLIEVSMFAVIALLIADLGEVMIASHQVTLSFTGLVFMLPLSISMALTIRIGHQLGKFERTGAKFTAQTGLISTLTLALCSSSLIAIFASSIASLYTSDQEIIMLAKQLLLIAALFQFSDAIQITCSGCLRGYKDTTIPLFMVFIAYWLIGLPGGYILGKTSWLVEPMGPAGFWIGLLLGLTIGAILLLLRLYHQVNNNDASTAGGQIT